ncbi:MAG TPA: hypothetical protein VGK73_20940, partial [Polyangiaceae bacterium]
MGEIAEIENATVIIKRESDGTESRRIAAEEAYQGARERMEKWFADHSETALPAWIAMRAVAMH